MTQQTDPENTRELFREDAYLRSTEARIVAMDALDPQTGIQVGIQLDRTVFYPTGGGQPGDTGVLRTASGAIVPVVDTVKGPEGQPGQQGIIHAVKDAGALSVGDVVTAEIDWSRRYAHMRMHSLLHLILVAVPSRINGCQIGAEKSRVDFDVEDPSSLDKAAIEACLNDLVAQDLPVGARWITDAELDANPDLVRTMSVQPPRGSGQVRLIEVAGIDLQPCGGTHVARTGEIGPVRLGKIENKGKHNRRINLLFAQ